MGARGGGGEGVRSYMPFPSLSLFLSLSLYCSISDLGEKGGVGIIELARVPPGAGFRAGEGLDDDHTVAHHVPQLAPRDEFA